MAQYLIVHDSGEVDEPIWVTQVEAKNMTAAARTLDVHDGFTAQIYRIAGPPKTITMTVETSMSVDVT